MSIAEYWSKSPVTLTSFVTIFAMPNRDSHFTFSSCKPRLATPLQREVRLATLRFVHHSLFFSCISWLCRLSSVRPASKSRHGDMGHVFVLSMSRFRSVFTTDGYALPIFRPLGIDSMFSEVFSSHPCPVNGSSGVNASSACSSAQHQ